jgi:hypothetical protein
MKSDIFINAILNRNRVRFLYDLKEVIIDPYFISINRSGKKVLYGKLNRSNEVKLFEFDKILNIKIMNTHKFSPIIPILPV